MSSKRLDTIADFARHSYLARIECLNCKRVTLMEPIDFLLIIRKRQWPRDVAAVEMRLRCSHCQARQARIGPGFQA